MELAVLIRLFAIECVSISILFLLCLNCRFQGQPFKMAVPGRFPSTRAYGNRCGVAFIELFKMASDRPTASDATRRNSTSRGRLKQSEPVGRLIGDSWRQSG